LEFWTAFFVELIPTITTIPILPGFFNGIVEAIAIIGAKDISVSLLMNWIAFCIHRLTPLFNYLNCVSQS
jgi:hypothetical protein